MRATRRTSRSGSNASSASTTRARWGVDQRAWWAHNLLGRRLLNNRVMLLSVELYLPTHDMEVTFLKYVMLNHCAQHVPKSCVDMTISPKFPMWFPCDPLVRSERLRRTGRGPRWGLGWCMFRPVLDETCVSAWN